MTSTAVFETSSVEYRIASSEKRARRRERALARVPEARRVDPSKVVDPTGRHEDTPQSRTAILWLGASLGAHLVIVVAGLVAPAESAPDSRDYDRAVEILDVPPPPLPAPTVEPTVPPPEQPVEPAKPIVARAVPVKEVAPKEEPSPDPTLPPDPTPARPARRVIGLNLESTTGTGPAFAVGNTRMGETARVAGDPNAAAGRPSDQLIPPRRTHEESPEYPANLKAQNIEGDVGLRVEIDAEGHVTSVVVAQPSSYEEFNQAAIVSARRGTYDPATLNGARIANTIQFTVRFRVRR